MGHGAENKKRVKLEEKREEEQALGLDTKKGGKCVFSTR